MPRPVHHLGIVLILLGGGCAQRAGPASEVPSPAGGGSAFPVTITDDEGVDMTLDAAPDRIVTFAPSHTEIVFALGLGDRLVGVSGAFDDYPPEAEAIEEVGGSNGVEPNIEKVISLEPDVVLTAFIGGDWKVRLRELDVPVFTTLASSFDDTLADIETIGRLLGAEDAAARVTRDMAADAETAEAFASGFDPVTCFLDFGDLFTVGPGSLEFDLMERAGCRPITASADDPYPQWSVERLVEDDPEVYLASEGIDVDRVSKEPGIRDLTAVRRGQIYPVDADLITRPGPRAAEGIRVLAEALHGQASAA
jgi:iron complex transport system substrate-binding protein